MRNWSSILDRRHRFLYWFFPEQGRSTWTDPTGLLRNYKILSVWSFQRSFHQTAKIGHRLRQKSSFRNWKITRLRLLYWRSIFSCICGVSLPAQQRSLQLGALMDAWIHSNRSFTVWLQSNFLHNGFDHLFNNMIVFILIGSRLNRSSAGPDMYLIYGSRAVRKYVSPLYTIWIGRKWWHLSVHRSYFRTYWCNALDLD